MKNEKLKLAQARQKIRSFFLDERGDTNFISILVVLGIVLVVAVVFIGFKDQIVGKASEMVGDFLEQF